ncbi:MarR family winged helix-turn-helix transcriptional regulator [Angustibacter luteus]|uniref:MarR family winged helix-turn-helix transcriptional regulator n=1 Tax=Angustibacter luteus TaxID=658456 RepID=A0ABW1JF40_9ACTN
MSDRTDLVDVLARLSFLVQGTLSDLAAEHGLSLAQVRLGGILRDHEPTMNELGQHLGLDKSSVSGLVDRAERRGLVVRRPSTSDRRVVHVIITAEGRALAEQVGAAFADQVETLTANLTATDRRALVRAAGRILIT